MKKLSLVTYVVPLWGESRYVNVLVDARHAQEAIELAMDALDDPAHARYQSAGQPLPIDYDLRTP